MRSWVFRRPALETLFPRLRLQHAVLGLSSNTTTETRVTQGAVEVALTETTVAARVSQGAVEVVMTDDANSARVSQLVAEVLSPVVAATRVTQIVAELLIPIVVAARITQIVVELIGKSSTYCGPPSLSPAALCGKPDVLAWLEWTVPMKES